MQRISNHLNLNLFYDVFHRFFFTCMRVSLARTVQILWVRQHSQSTSTDSRELQVVNKEMVADVGHLAGMVQGWKGRYHPVPSGTIRYHRPRPAKTSQDQPRPAKRLCHGNMPREGQIRKRPWRASSPWTKWKGVRFDHTKLNKS